MTRKAGQVQVASKQIIKWSKTSGKLSASPWRDAKQEEDLLIFIIFSDQFDQKINILIYLSIYLNDHIINSSIIYNTKSQLYGSIKSSDVVLQLLCYVLLEGLD